MASESKASTKIELTDGALVIIDSHVYFIPRDELKTFKVPTSVAAEVHARLKERTELTRGHPNDGILLGAQLNADHAVLDFSSLYEHALTIKMNVG